MVRGLRFILFAGLLVTTVARNAPALRRSIDLLLSPAVYSPGAPCLPVALGGLGVAAAYAVWLCGATFSRWRMPVAVHLAPLGALLLTAWRGPLPIASDAGALPAERALAAMEALSQRLEQVSRPCEGDAAPACLPPGDSSSTGFFSHGRPLPFRVVVDSSSSGPVREARPGDAPGTLYLACDGAGAFWLTAVTLDRLPKGSPTMVKDGVGRVAVVRGEAR